MRYIVLDTNCLLQSLPSKSPYHKIWTDIMDGEISLCVNTDILDEYEEKLAEHTSAEVAHNVVEAIATLPTTTMQNTYVHFELLPGDADDNKFVDCAIASNIQPSPKAAMSCAYMFASFIALGLASVVRQMSANWVKGHTCPLTHQSQTL